MDPDANLHEQRQITQKFQAGEASQADLERLAELVDSLDCWILRNGGLPESWEQARNGAVRKAMRGIL